MPATVTTRSGKGAEITWAEADASLISLRDTANASEATLATHQTLTTVGDADKQVGPTDGTTVMWIAGTTLTATRTCTLLNTLPRGRPQRVVNRATGRVLVRAQDPTTPTTFYTFGTLERDQFLHLQNAASGFWQLLRRDVLVTGDKDVVTGAYTFAVQDEGRTKLYETNADVSWTCPALIAAGDVTRIVRCRVRNRGTNTITFVASGVTFRPAGVTATCPAGAHRLLEWEAGGGTAYCWILAA